MYTIQIILATKGPVTMEDANSHRKQESIDHIIFILSTQKRLNYYAVHRRRRRRRRREELPYLKPEEDDEEPLAAAAAAVAKNASHRTSIFFDILRYHVVPAKRASNIPIFQPFL